MSLDDQDPLEARRDRLRAQTPDGSLRSYAGKGVLVNASWTVGLQGVNFLRGVLVAIFLSPYAYGVWSILVVGYLTVFTLKSVGIVDKYIQQDDLDEETAFQKAFTLEAILMGGFWIVLILVTPVLAVVYQAPEIILPGLVSLLAIPALVLQTPVWKFQRDMDFVRQRRLTAIDPIVGAIVTVTLAAAGASYWSFAIGSVVGSWAAAIAILRYRPFPLRLRYDRGTAREYVHFSLPLLYANLSTILLLQGTLLIARPAIGVAGLGALALASSVRTYTEFADQIVSSTMYPAICAAKDKLDVLHETFVKSNRLALMWGFPFGIGMVLFAADLVDFVLGDEWAFAVLLFQATGAVSAIGHIAFNWDSYIRALGDTRPMAKYAWFSVGIWFMAPIPLMVVDGLHGYAIGLFFVAAVQLALRAYFMRQLFPTFEILRHALRAILPILPATAAVLAIRQIESSGDRTLGIALIELTAFVGLTLLVTWMSEKALLREAVGYLRRGRSEGVGIAA